MFLRNTDVPVSAKLSLYFVCYRTLLPLSLCLLFYSLKNLQVCTVRVTIETHGAQSAGNKVVMTVPWHWTLSGFANDNFRMSILEI